MAARVETRVSLPEDQLRRLRETARVQRVTEDQLVERALDILFSLTADQDPVQEHAGWAALSEGSLARVWDNDEDARYDAWQDLYGTPPR